MLFCLNWESFHQFLLSIDLTLIHHEGNTVEERYLVLGRWNIGDWIVKEDSGERYRRC